jgi:hypothetical protein
MSRSLNKNKIEELFNIFLDIIKEESISDELTALKTVEAICGTKIIDFYTNNDSKLSNKEDIFVINWGNPNYEKYHIRTENYHVVSYQILITGISKKGDLDKIIRQYFKQDVEVFRVDEPTRDLLLSFGEKFPTITDPPVNELGKPRLEVVGGQHWDFLRDVLKNSRVESVAYYPA